MADKPTGAKDAVDTVRELNKEQSEAAPLAEGEKEKAAERSHLRAAVVFEIIRREGEGELARGFSALWWSGIAAGLSIGFSVLTEAYLSAHLPDEPWKPLVDNLGYSVGFLIVIMSRQQLFTENTLTAVLPFLSHGGHVWWLVLLRLWGIVLLANLIGSLIFAYFIVHSGILSPDVAQAVTRIGEEMMSNTPAQMFFKAIVSGWLIAALVWMLPSAENSEFLVITLMTYLIALFDLTHVVAGSTEAFQLYLVGRADVAAVVGRFLLPTLAGNVVGGTLLFAVVSYAQVRSEIKKTKADGG